MSKKNIGILIESIMFLSLFITIGRMAFGIELLFIFIFIIVYESVLTFISYLLRIRIKTPIAYFIPQILLFVFGTLILYILIEGSSGWDGLGYAILLIANIILVILSLPGYLILIERFDRNIE